MTTRLFKQTTGSEDSGLDEAEAAENPGNDPDGDFRGPYGFGRPAYRPDPEASYSFDPGPRRTLAVDPRRRWR